MLNYQLTSAMSALKTLHEKLGDDIDATELPKVKFRYLGQEEWLVPSFVLDVDATIEVVVPLSVGNCVIARVKCSDLANKILNSDLVPINLRYAPTHRHPFEELGLATNILKTPHPNPRFDEDRWDRGLMLLQPAFPRQHVELSLSVNTAVSQEREPAVIVINSLATTRTLQEWLIPMTKCHRVTNATGPAVDEISSDKGVTAPLRVQHSAGLFDRCGSSLVFSNYSDASSWAKTTESLDLMYLNLKAIQETYAFRQEQYHNAKNRILKIHRDVTGEKFIPNHSPGSSPLRISDSEERPSKRARRH